MVAGAPAADVLLVYKGGRDVGGVAFDVTMRSVIKADGTAVMKPRRRRQGGDAFTSGAVAAAACRKKARDYEPLKATKYDFVPVAVELPSGRLADASRRGLVRVLKALGASSLEVDAFFASLAAAVLRAQGEYTLARLAVHLGQAQAKFRGVWSRRRRSRRRHRGNGGGQAWRRRERRRRRGGAGGDGSSDASAEESDNSDVGGSAAAAAAVEHAGGPQVSSGSAAAGGGELDDDEDRVDSQGDRPISKHVQGRQTANENRGAGRRSAASDSAERSARSAGLPSSAGAALPAPSPSSSSSATGGGAPSLRPLDGAAARAVEGFEMDFEVPQALDAGSTMILRVRLQQHQLPVAVRAPEGGLRLRVPFRVPPGGLVGGERVFGVCRQGQFWATSVSRQLSGVGVAAAGAGGLG